MKTVVALAIGCMLFSAGCGSWWNSSHRRNVRNQAAFLLSCPKSSITLNALSTRYDGLVTSYGAYGCGKRLVFNMTEHGEWRSTKAR